MCLSHIFYFLIFIFMERLKSSKSLKILFIFNEISWYLVWLWVLMLVLIFFVGIFFPNEVFLEWDFLFSPLEFFLTLLSLFILIIIISYFRKLFNTLKQWKVFVDSNVTLLQRIAYLSIILSITSIDFSDLETLLYSADIIFYSLLILVFSIIFKYWVEMKNDNNLTI